ncbi:hypothetical protein ACRRLC_004180, partial [Acinetobacter baumannii]
IGRVFDLIYYSPNSNNAIRFNWDYEKQNHLDWMKSSLGYVWFF